MKTTYDKNYEVFLEEQKNRKPREIGRYYASEVGDIIDGHVTPRNYFDGNKLDKKAAFNMRFGGLFDSFVKGIHKNLETDRRLEIVMEEGCVIVGKLDGFGKDAEGNEVVFEYKTCRRFPVRPYLNNIYQMTCYLEGTNTEYGWLVYFLKDFTDGLKEVSFKVKRDKNRWNDIKVAVLKFHKELIKLNPK